MNSKFIRLLSPIRMGVVALLDAAALGYGIYAVKKLAENPRASVVFFAACVLAAIILAALVTREVLSNGVKFYDDELEFNGLDDDNIFAYADIEKVETFKDTKASLVKNFTDRQSKVIFTMKDGRVVTVDIGLTTKKVLAAVENEINSRIETA